MRGFFSAKYCYRFFFYYLTAYLRVLIETENADARATLTREMAEFLIGCWIDARMNAADDAAKQINMKNVRLPNQEAHVMALEKVSSGSSDGE